MKIHQIMHVIGGMHGMQWPSQYVAPTCESNASTSAECPMFNGRLFPSSQNFEDGLTTCENGTTS